MSSVDNRVVQMQFDNAAFESKVASTMQSLDKLKTSLDFTNSKRGLDDLSAAGKSFNMGNIGSAVDGISTKFMAMATIGITALANITNRAVNAGMQIARSLTIAPVSQGFAEYEQGLTAFQTIVANTKSAGTTVDQVNTALAELNKYANLTIYSFGDMTKAVGLFTAQGVSLPDSLTGIKGIFNLVSLTGGNADKANSAIYQLSQAIASGTVRAQDWISVVNAGIGGTDFQNALKQTARTHGVAVDDMIKKNGSFRDSLQEGWLSSQILLETLNQYTGDLNEQQLISMGYSAEQAKSIVSLGKTALESATKVKTYTQLMDTLKSNVVTGWATSFKTIIGNLDEAAIVWTEIGNGIGGVLQSSSDARNKLLSDWKTLGGRDLLFQGLKDAVKSITLVISAIKNAFRSIFPRKTAEDLFSITKGFAEFANMLRLGVLNLVPKLTQIFKGLFAGIQIVVEIVKGAVGLFGSLFGTLAGAASGPILGFFSKIASFLIDLNTSLVKGGGIKDFFASLEDYIRRPSESLVALKERVIDFLKSFSLADGVSGIADRIGTRFETLSNILKKLGDLFNWFGDRIENVKNIFGGIFRVLDKVWDALSGWFSQLGQKLAAVMKPGDFDAAVDVVNMGLLGGIAIMLKKFLKTGFNFKLDTGTTGVFDKIKTALDGLTGTLRAMQANLQSKTLLRIAGAVGILTISIVALSLIDSVSLTKALTAISVGFAQLVGAMAILDKATSGKSSAKLAVVATGMMILGAAMAILSIAVKNLASLSWEELAKGLLGVTVMLAVLTTSTNLIAKDTSGMVRAGVAMIPMAIGLLILSQAVKAFSTMSWGEMAKGMAGVAVGLGVIVAAMNLMPVGSTIAAGLAMIPLAIGLTILAGAVKLFSLMSWEDMAKGMVGIGAGLLIIAGAMHLMPLTLPVTAAGLVILATAMGMMAGVIGILGKMKIETLATGIGALAGTLLVLSLGMNSMTGTIGGAAALLISANALLILAAVLKTLGTMKIGDLLIGLAAIAGVMAILGISAHLLSPVIPALMALGVALTLVGASFALFGAGAMLIAKAFEVMVKLGSSVIKVLLNTIEEVIKAIPAFISALVVSLMQSAGDILATGRLLIAMATVLVIELLDSVIKVIPKFMEMMDTLLTGLITLIWTRGPEFIATGFMLLMEFLRGLRDNIEEITKLVVDIIVKFTGELANNAQKIVDAAVNLLTTFLGAIAAKAGDVVTSAANVIASFLEGIANNVSKIITAGTDIIIKFIEGVGANAVRLANAAGQTILDFLNGLTAAVNNYAPKIREATLNLGWAIINGISGGLAERIGDVITWLGGLVTKIPEWVGDLSTVLKNAGKDVINGLWNGMKDVWNEVTGWLSNLNPANWFNDINPYKGHAIKNLFSTGSDVISGLLDGMRQTWSDVAVWLEHLDPAENLDKNVVSNIQKVIAKIPSFLSDMTDLNPTITPVLDLTRVQQTSRDLNRMLAVSALSPMISPTVSYAQANQIAKTTEIADTESKVPSYQGPSELKFEQNIYSPSALSTNDIYRNTKSQIAKAKEELRIA